MRFINFRLRSERGDTIVEVLICIAILGFLLAAAYALTNKNQISSQKTQERAVAISHANTQLERLRSYIKTTSVAAMASGGGNFCLTVNPSPPYNLVATGFIAPNNPDQDITIDSTKNYGSCLMDGRYRVSIWKPGNIVGPDAVDVGGIAGSNAFAVTVRWEVAGGGGQDEVKMFYVLHEATP